MSRRWEPWYGRVGLKYVFIVGLSLVQVSIAPAASFGQQKFTACEAFVPLFCLTDAQFGPHTRGRRGEASPCLASATRSRLGDRNYKSRGLKPAALALAPAFEGPRGVGSGGVDKFEPWPTWL